jgi:hypothetical protein
MIRRRVLLAALILALAGTWLAGEKPLMEAPKAAPIMAITSDAGTDSAESCCDVAMAASGTTTSSRMPSVASCHAFGRSGPSRQGAHEEPVADGKNLAASPHGPAAPDLMKPEKAAFAGRNVPATEKGQAIRATHPTMEIPDRPVQSLPQRGSMLIKCGDVPVGFHFEPDSRNRGMLVMELTPGQRSEISFHGPGAQSCHLDGLPVTAGAPYPVHDGQVLTATAEVGVHLRPARPDPQAPLSSG